MLTYYQYWVAEFSAGKPTGNYFPLEIVQDEKGRVSMCLVTSTVMHDVLLSMQVIGHCWLLANGQYAVEYFA